MVAKVRGVVLVVTLYHPVFLTLIKRLCDFFLLEPLKNGFGDVITHGAGERDLITGAGIACFLYFSFENNIRFQIFFIFINWG